MVVTNSNATTWKCLKNEIINYDGIIPRIFQAKKVLSIINHISW